MQLSNNLSQWCWRRGCRGCKRTSKSFYLLKIRAKCLKIWNKSLKIWAKFVKIQEKCLKAGQIPCKSYQNCAQRCLTSKNGAQRLQRNTRRRFLRTWHQKEVFYKVCGRKFAGKSHTKTFRVSLGKFGQKSFTLPKICLLHVYYKLASLNSTLSVSEYVTTTVTATMGVRRWSQCPMDFENSGKKIVSLVSRGKKRISSLLAPLEKILSTSMSKASYISALVLPLESVSLTSDCCLFRYQITSDFYVTVSYNLF